MIRTEHVRDDAKVLSDKIEKGTVTIADVAKFCLTLGNLLLSVRSNQILVMKKEGVELVKPRVRTETKSVDSE